MKDVNKNSLYVTVTKYSEGNLETKIYWTSEAQVAVLIKENCSVIRGEQRAVLDQHEEILWQDLPKVG